MANDADVIAGVILRSRFLAAREAAAGARAVNNAADFFRDMAAETIPRRRVIELLENLAAQEAAR